MNKKLLLTLLVGGAVVLTGCNKKISQFDSNYFSVNPSPLEVQGNTVPGKVTAKIPAKVFVKNAEVTVTPLLNVNGQEIAGQAYTFQGEKVRGNNPVISYKQGGTFMLPIEYAYTPGMEDASLSLKFDVTQGKKQYALPTVTVAKGVNTTSTIADVATSSPAIAPDKYQRVVQEQYSTSINFLINSSVVRDSEMKSESMISFIDTLSKASADSTRKIKDINQTSAASPEGTLEINEKVASGREKTTSEKMHETLKAHGIVDYGEIMSSFKTEDWEGFQKLVSESNIQDKDLILQVLSMYEDPEIREKEIRNMTKIFDELKTDILPKLRYSRIIATVDVIGKSDEQIKEAYASDPKSLTVEQLLYMANLTKDNKEKVNVYQTAANIYSNDYRTFNNLGACQFAEGNYTEAAKNIKKALELNPSCGEANMNLSLISMLSNDYNNAKVQLGKATGITEASEALGVYYLKNGDNQAAVRAFGDVKSNNAALAQILTKDYSKAKKTIAGINAPDATTHYLSAIIGARTGNEDLIIGSLRQAIKLDSSLKTKALKDPEFANYNIASKL